MHIVFVADAGTEIASTVDEKALGGAERVLSAYVKGSRRRGHDVDVLSRDPIGPHSAKERKIPLMRPLHVLGRLMILPFAFRRICCKSVPDVINFHQPLSAFFVLLHPRARSIARVYTFHSSAAQEYAVRLLPGKCDEKGRSPRQRLNVFLRKWVERYAIKKSQAVVVLSDFSRRVLRDLHKVPPPPVIRIPGGVDTYRFQPVHDRLYLKEKLAPGFSHFLLTIRNLEPRMGLENLIHAMTEVVKRHPDTVLVIGGEGPLKKDLMSLVARLNLGGNIRFEGFIPEDKLAAYYQGADFFVLPTRALEGFGLVTVEALACGTPVIGTPVGGTLEILKGLDERLLCEGVEPEHLASRIDFFLTHPKELARIRKQCRSYVVEHYDWERVINHLEEVFETYAGTH